MITKKELLNRIYDDLFDMVGFSEHHVPIETDIEIIDQRVSCEDIYISILENGTPREFKLTIKEL